MDLQKVHQQEIKQVKQDGSQELSVITVFGSTGSQGKSIIDASHKIKLSCVSSLILLPCPNIRNHSSGELPAFLFVGDFGFVNFLCVPLLFLQT